MSIDNRLNFLSSRLTFAAAIYVATMVIFVVAIWMAISSVLERQAIVASAEDVLARLEGRIPSTANTAGSPFGAAPPGSPFLRGQTMTVAGAALLERIAGAVTKVGGSVLSSQVDLQKADAQGGGWISLIVSCDVEPASLQQLLYDIEAGMPFLFLEQLVAQAPVIGDEQTRMHVLFTVSGQWEGRK